VAFKVHAFLALTIGSLFVGLASGIAAGGVTKSYENGVGSVLGYVGVLIALGAMVGKLLADSGGADQVVDTLLRGKPSVLPWKMALVAAIIGIPMFFEIGLVLLVPVVVLAIRRSGAKAMLLGIPALAGLSVLHGFVPPHPGPLAAIGILHGNVGITLALGLLVAIPAVVIAGPLFGRLAARWVPIGAGGAALEVTGGAGAQDTVASSESRADGSVESRPDGSAADPERTRTPSFTMTIVTVLSPVVLMLLKAASDVWMSPDAALYPVLQFIGDPVFALLFAVLLAMYTFGTAIGFGVPVLSKKIGASLLPISGVMMIVGAGGGFKQVLVDGGTGTAIGFGVPVLSKKIGASLLPISGVMMIVGAGGGFKQVLVDGGTGTAIAKIAIAANLSALLLGWIVAVLIRLATGSATVATVTAAGIVAPLAAGQSTTQIALIVLAIGAGSLFFSHVNDAGFWLVKEYFGMTVGETIKTWSVMETLISIIGLGMTLLLSAFF
jgi:GntP family gluconate:H+ symporter